MKTKYAGALPPGEAARLAEQLKRHEGLRLAAYLDGGGALTVGYGHNCRARPVEGVSLPGDRISRELADSLFREDFRLAEAQAVSAMPWLENMSWPRRAVLVNMTFNMGLGGAGSGRGVLGFRRMLAALRRGDYGAAAPRDARQPLGRSGEAQGQRTGRPNGKRRVARKVWRPCLNSSSALRGGRSPGPLPFLPWPAWRRSC